MFCIQKLTMSPSFKAQVTQLDKKAVALGALTLFCATAPLEISQLIFVLVGAMAYGLLQATQVASPAYRAGPTKAREASSSTPPHSLSRGAPRNGSAPQQHWPNGSSSRLRKPPFSNSSRLLQCESGPAQKPPAAARLAESKPDIRTSSSQPIAPKAFDASGWEEAVTELLGEITPSPESDRVVEQLAKIVKRTLTRLFPGIEVVGFTSGDLLRGTAFGVAVPEVDIVATMNPDTLSKLLKTAQRGGGITDPRKLQKAAIRACTDKLVSSGSFKFRRSAFRGKEPKVTLLAPASLGIHTASIPIDFSINCITPLYLAALRTHCGQIDPRAKDLILLVRRWAKDRGICHSAKGHLSPYAWSVLAVYYLQVGLDADGGAILPPVEDLAEQLTGKGTLKACESNFAHQNKKSVGALFQGFAHFYAKDFDWRNEGVSVRRGKRGPPDLTLPLHIILHEDGVTTEVGPSIEDPVQKDNNLGDCTSKATCARLREELQRADELCQQESPSLSTLLELWAPPETPERQGEGEDAE
jgi:hypothetical protein